MLVVPNLGERLLLDAAVGKTPATAWTLRLFTNNHIPASGDTEADYTEAADGGYAAIPLNAANWTTTPGAPTVTVQPEQTFTFTGALLGGASIYGYYLTDASGALVLAERLSAVFMPTNPGDTVNVTARITLGSVSGD